jgi:hypothetical protein
MTVLIRAVDEFLYSPSICIYNVRKKAPSPFLPPSLCPDTTVWQSALLKNREILKKRGSLPS